MVVVDVGGAGIKQTAVTGLTGKPTYLILRLSHLRCLAVCVVVRMLNRLSNWPVFVMLIFQLDATVECAC